MIDNTGPRKIKKFGLDLVLHPAQQKIEDSQARFKYVRAGRRFGKTKYALYRMLKWAEKKNSNIWLVAPSYRQAKEIAWRELLKMIPPAAITKRNDTELSVELPNHSTLSLKGSDNEDSLRGVALDGVVIEEMPSQKGWVWEEVIRPMLVDRAAPALFIGSPKGRDWAWRLEMKAREAMESGSKDWDVFHFTIHDNPHIPTEEIQKAKLETSEQVWRQEYMAEYDTAEGLVYPEFDERIHTTVPILTGDLQRATNSGSPMYRSFDWGLRNPSCCLWAYIDNQLGKQYVRFFKEHYKAELTIPQHSQTIKGSSSGMNIRATFCDPSMRNRNEHGFTKLNEFARFGLNMVPADNKVDYGIEIVKRFIRDGLVTFTTDMVKTLSEFRTYEWEDVEAGDLGPKKEKPKKSRDHAMDAVRYMLVSLNRLHNFFGTGEKTVAKIVNNQPIYRIPPDVPEGTVLDTESGYF